MSRRLIVLTALAGLALSPTLLPAQEQPAPPPQGENRGGDRSSDRGGDRDGDRGGDRGGRGGNFDPAQFRERYMTRLKEDLGANDEEWKVLQPKVEKVMEARREVGGGFGGGRGGRGGGGGGGQGGDSSRQTNAVEQAARELNQLLENKEAPADQITAKLTALRDAREKARTNLVAAQKELKEILSQRQEAVLVTQSMLE